MPPYKRPDYVPFPFTTIFLIVLFSLSATLLLKYLLLKDLVMRLSSSFLAVISVLYPAAIANPTHVHVKALDSFITTERAIALQGVLNNIGPHGSRVPGAGAGYVVASPSTENPNCQSDLIWMDNITCHLLIYADFYTWSRDSALTLKMVIDEFTFGNASLKPIIDDYIHSQAVLQTVANPSGTFLPQGLGLGEPKFMVDGTRFNGNWGRPQRDGPSLRAIALMTYSNWLIQNGKTVRLFVT